jgi:prepilin-type N-terminal cleavage/methylation domain-containing protein
VSGTAPAGRRARAFTLIEVLAVVAILALTAVLVTPNLAALRERRLRHAAERLAAELELARQRAVVTGIPHRVFFDLEGGVYRLEWLGVEEEEEIVPVAADAEYDLRGATALPLVAPHTTAFEFAPLPDSFGNYREFEGGIFVAGLETAEGFLERGQADVTFERDGTAAYTEIVLEEPGGARRSLAVLPLEDSVRFVEEEQP